MERERKMGKGRRRKGKGKENGERERGRKMGKGKGKGKEKEKGKEKGEGKGSWKEDSLRNVGRTDARTHGRTDTQVILCSVQCYALHWTDNNNVGAV